MNRITIENDRITKKQVDQKIQIEVEAKNCFFTVNTIKFHILENTTLEIDYQIKKESKLKLLFVVHSNVSFHLLETRQGEQLKVQYQYQLEEDAYLDIQKISMNCGIKELDIIELNGENATFESVLKTLSLEREKYDMMVCHNAPKTKSNLINHGVTMEHGEIIFNVTGVVEQGIKDCILNQNNRIVMNGKEESRICPNLLIEEQEVEANHSALIGRLGEDEIFYLESRGIAFQQAVKLLVKGFLLGNLNISETMKDQLIQKIETYWR